MERALDSTKKATIELVMEEASKYIHNADSLAMINKAYEVAKKYHEGQFRKSGEPYLQHPLEVAFMLASLRVGPATIAAGFLHDVVEDTPYTLDQLKADFNDDVASIVDGVTKIGQLKYITQEKALAKTHQKILLAMAKDVRVILVKLVDRVHNMRTIEFQPDEKRRRICQETLDLYAPLAHRLGMYRIKAELEDRSYMYLNPEKYSEIQDLINKRQTLCEEDISHMEEGLKELLDHNHIQNYQIKGRIKNIYSVCKKMETKHLEFDQIYDLLALRILVNSVEECYRVLGLVHGQWSPIPRRFKDYIAIPKPNLYQSLHTTVVGPNGKIYEIQIRTYEMDSVAELGVAAHWAYKEGSYTPQAEQLEIANKLKWYKDLLVYAEQGEEEDKDPLSNIQNDIFSANVYVFTPKGDVFDFPNGATPLDFAYRIHTEVGNHTVGAIVNGKIVPLTYKLKTGDVIEIKTNKSFNGPNEAWLKIVATSHARHKIIAILNKQKRDEYIERGKNEHMELCKLENVATDSDFYKLSDKTVSDMFSKIGVNTLEDLYYEVGKGTISIRNVYNRMCGNNVTDEEALIKQYNENQSRAKLSAANFKSAVIVEGFPKAHVKFANCCHPVMGDPIVGYVSKSSGIIVHRIECHNNNNSQSERMINCYWNPDYESTYESILHIYSFDRRNIVAEIINVLNSCAITIIKISSGKNKNGDLLTKVSIKVKDIDAIENASVNLMKIADIYEIERAIK